MNFALEKDSNAVCSCTIFLCFPERLVLFSLSKHLPSPETMSFNVDVDELENSHGATYIRKKAAKVVGESQPKEQG